ncbi:MAG: PQQ-dependent sugar dehydrogenase [Flavobacterium sp.]|uniref:PQQ-dependent sugar dehydrogenase n=1 Tax=Flavobacterium sp. TaxID=239 RepID=UPI0022BA9E4F|nr:PQQ-dependent sugar dehydrogenase [Flavobacterium sp.]MCZ8196338.1 PQQ-dependent sugar dehydrogenase [Flavobacterium sp.]
MKKIIYINLLLLLNVSIAQTLTFQTFATGLSGAVEMVHPPNDTRLFVVQQGGLIRILNTNGTINTTPFINLSSLVVSGGEQGLLGLAFHPNYATNGQFFVNYTRASDGATVIAKYTVSTANPNVANTAGTILMTIAQPFTNHNGGCIRFGSDGYLYIGMGDGGSGGDPGNRSQNITNNLGKMLRIDVDNPVAPLNYGIPPTNPYVGIAGNDEIWAIGLRNPWKFSFNRLNGDLWIADVGQNAVEEINKVASPVPAGLNFGWRCYEGNVPYNTSGCAAIGTMTMPFAQYSHDEGCSITGGYLYTGSLYPNLVGKYVFADYCQNRLGYVSEDGTITYSANFTGSNNFTTFGEDLNGELYISKGNAILKVVDTSVLSSSSFEKAGYSIFPNPANNEFFIKNSNGFSNLKVTVFDISGKMLLSQSIENESNKIATSALSSGMYLVKLEDKSGAFYTTKLVIE